MELPTLPAEHGHSLGVRRRVERSFPAVRAAVGLFEVTKVALDRKFGERVRRTSGPGEEAGGDGRERYVSVPDFLLFIGREIEQKRDELVRADLALAEQRRIRRRACGRRDWRKRKLYDARVKFKQEAQQKLGRKRWRNAIMINGETPRNPLELTRQAGLDLTWASGPLPPRLGLEDYPVDWKAMTAPLEPLRDDLDAAIDAVFHEDALVTQKLADRITAMEAFDDWYAKGARTLECTYVLLGLPTLAAAVRPHLKVAGRVGRPSKLPPVDDYPDLVERARAAGLLPAELGELRAAPAKADEKHRLAAWMAVYREAIVPYLSFLAGLEVRSPRSGAPAGRRSTAAAWPARALARWRRDRT